MRTATTHPNLAYGTPKTFGRIRTPPPPSLSKRVGKSAILGPSRKTRNNAPQLSPRNLKNVWENQDPHPPPPRNVGESAISAAKTPTHPYSLRSITKTQLMPLYEASFRDLFAICLSLCCSLFVAYLQFIRTWFAFYV